MYKAFIVDDEKLVRNGLINHVNWSDYSIVIVGEAADGKEAMEALEKDAVDILITDVRMPFVDGIELAHWLKEKNPKMKVIFISGYESVDYLKSAIKIDAVDYILKSIDLNEFEQAIKRAVNNLNSELSQKQHIEKMEQKLRQSIPLLQEKFLVTLIRDEISDLSVVEKRAQFLNIRLNNTTSYCIMVLQQTNYYSLYSKMSEHEKQIFSYSILEICNKLIKQYYTRAICFENNQGEFVFILPEEGDNYENALLELVEELKENLNNSLGVSGVFGVSQQFAGFANMNTAYIGAENSILQGYNISDSYPLTVDKYANVKKGEEFIRSSEKKLAAALNKGEVEKTGSILSSEVFPFILKQQNHSKQQDIFTHLLLLPKSAVLSNEAKRLSGYSNVHGLLEQYMCCSGTNEICIFLLKKYTEIASFIRDTEENHANVVVVQIKDIISKKYMYPITIADIGNEIYLTPTYLCVLFKHETNQTINEYITEFRIEQAKILLGNTQMNQNSISRAVGYSSLNHFSRLFKKIVGCTPGQYRKMLILQK